MQGFNLFFITLFSLRKINHEAAAGDKLHFIQNQPYFATAVVRRAGKRADKRKVHNVFEE